MQLEDINCPPYAPVLMESTRAIGYSIESAVADIIDNSIAAGAKTVSIYFDDQPVPYVAIIDDGQGMDSATITESMRYGSSNPGDVRKDNDLGRYGLGLKTASLSQCRCLTVISKLGHNVEGRRWDLDHIYKTQQWSLEQLDDKTIYDQLEYDELESLPSGTMVLWTELDRIQSGSITIGKALDDKMESVQNHLELVFHRYLSGDGVPRLQIFMNGNRLIPFDPFFVAKSTVVMDDEKIDIPGRSGRVIIRPYILPHPSKMSKEELEKYGGKEGLKNLQGFYIYRNKRLLTWGTWFNLQRKDEFSKLARVRVDIPNSLDDLWTLDVKKSKALPPDIVKTRLKQLVGTISDSSKRPYRFRQRKEITKGYVHVWDKVETREGVQYVVNMDHPVVDSLRKQLDDNSMKLLEQFLKTIQNELPFNNLHYDLESDVKIVVDKENDEWERIKSLAALMIRQAIKEDHLEETMSGFESIEPFMYHMDDIKKLCAEVKING